MQPPEVFPDALITYSSDENSLLRADISLRHVKREIHVKPCNITAARLTFPSRDISASIIDYSTYHTPYLFARL